MRSVRFCTPDGTAVKPLDAIRRTAVRSVFGQAPLAGALNQLGFVQADPIRAPARAQDLTLRPRVAGYREGDLERHYGSLPIEEDFFINYGYVTRSVQSLMHPRLGAALQPTAGNKHARAILDFIRERGSAHPREIDASFGRGRVTNYWGGSSSATTFLLEKMHYKGLLRVVRREAGIRIYAVQQHGPAPEGAAARRANLDALVDVLMRKYAPVPAASLSFILRRLRYAAPQWEKEVTGALDRARKRLPQLTVDGDTWYLAPNQSTVADDVPDQVRLLAPFDPVVWDRRRFELLFGWEYRFEAYTPQSKRKFGYYALPLLWRDRVIGWANLWRCQAMNRESCQAMNRESCQAMNRERANTAAQPQKLHADLGYIKGAAPRDRGFRRELEAELDRVRGFLRTATSITAEPG
jgi:uncharacterized protein YcaQ